MPPQSRGTPSDSASFDNDDTPPTLKPYLDNLPSPSHLLVDPRTPTASSRRSTVSAERDVNTPTRMHFSVGPDEDEEDEDTAPDPDHDQNDEDDDSATLDDDEFQSHYSRRSSSNTEEDDDAPLEMYSPTASANVNGHAHPPSNRLQRITSLPISPSQPPSTLPTPHSTTSLRLPPPPPPPLYPPFYNRPPTPLPPSPSLTSLLRPPSLLNRSTTSTRPTTPDSSDVETPLDTEAAVAHSARRAHPLPPTSPKVPTYEYYGFTLYLASTLAFIMYILWSYLPSPFLNALGISYYPNRYWSLAIPAWIVMSLIFVYVALLAYNVEYLTLHMANVECMVDDAGNVAVLDEHGRMRQGGTKRLVKEMDERRRFEEQRQHAKNKQRNGSWSSTSGKKKKRKENHRPNNKPPSAAPDGPGRWEREMRRMEAERQKNQQNNPLGHGYTVASFDAPNGDLSWRQIWNHATDGVMDIPLGGVCEVLYGDG